MSLNGLDDPSIIESYQSALAEAGGWFLLKYVSRDVVALLHRGSGGVVEIRAAITAYEETSPLYGFLQYRRRKIILRYVPEGISRLIQARITVQFQSILDRFSPHDTVFSLTAPAELTENALSSACMLHAASGSMTSSTSSLRQRRLGEITEDAEENGPEADEPRPVAQQQTSTMPSDHGRAESVFSGTSEATAVPAHRSLRDNASKARSESASSSLSPTQTPVLTTTTTSVPAPALVTPVSNHQTQNPRGNGLPQQHLLDHLSQSVYEPRRSSQSLRPSLRDLDQAASPHKQQKVRLGPRPSMDANGRPKTAGSMTRSSEPRPVASLPAGMRSRKQSASRPKSQPDYVLANVPSAAPGTAPPVPPLLVPPPPIMGAFSRHAPSSPRSIRSCATSIGMSPEKQRLMRALELRKQQMSRQSKKSEAISPEPPFLPELKGIQTDESVTKERSAIVGLTIDQDKPHASETLIIAENTTKNITSPQDSTGLPSFTPVFAAKITKPGSAVELSPSRPLIASASGKDVDAELTPPQTPPEELQQQQQQQQLELLRPVAYSAPKMIDIKPASQHGQTAHLNRLDIADLPDCSPAPAGVVQTSPESSLSSSIASHSTEKSSVVTSSSSTLRNVSDTESDILSKHTIYPNSSQSSIADEGPDVPKDPLSESVHESRIPDQEAEICPSQIAIPFDSDSDLSPSTPTPTPREAMNGHSVINEVHIDSPALNTEDDLKEEKESAEDSKTVRGPPESGEENGGHSKKEKRAAMLEPIYIPSSNVSNSEEDILLSDDSFMEELGSATLQEARPIAIPRTPTSSGGKMSSPADRWTNSRIVSNSSVRSDIEALPIGVASSRAFFESEKSAPVLVAKKVNVSSGISKRIKALEMFTSREASPVPEKTPSRPEQPKSSPSSAFEKFRKRASISQSPGSLSPSPSNLALPQLVDAAVIKNNDVKPPDGPARPKSKSVSVTARIVRGASTSSEHPPNLAEPSSLALQRSEITVEQNGEKAMPASSNTAARDKHQSVSSSAGSKRNSINGPKSIPSDTISNRHSISSRPKFDSSNSHSSGDVARYNDVDNADEAKDDKKGSRKSRIIRRMSSITANTRRKPTKEQKTSSASVQPRIEEDPTNGSLQPSGHAVDVGEVNVQFPDTLLWKRRFMRVDEAGYLILTPGTIDGNPRNTVKRYHLSEFRRPYLPDHDRQELPNSIMLDFCDGNTLQCACESKHGQGITLKTLIEAHHVHSQ